MRLEHITLHGFKSFSERTVLKVLPGITGIVGPNGCGKSNIAEAVRWALGEQSAKSLRGQRMEDLVFHGSASRKAVGMAEVDLVFSNDGTLAVPWTEIEVTRRVYRTGESEYLINRTMSRLRDILDLFAGTGANPRAYSIMDQDKLNHVLTAKPHERRVFIEEAAGIARYKQQRHETEGKLDAARQNLVRVRDVMDEVKRQLGSIERQAKRAAQYKALESERRSLALTLLAADYSLLAAEGERLGQAIAERRDAETALQAEAAQIAARTAVQRARLQESEHEVADLRQAVQKVQGELERLLERREQLGVQLRELRDEEQRLEDDRQSTAERLESIGREREMLWEAAREAETVVQERTRVAVDLDARLTHCRASLAADRDRLEARRQEQMRVVAERTDLMRQAGELRERQTQLARRHGRLSGELADANAEVQRLDDTRAGLEAQRDRGAAELAALIAERERLTCEVDEEARRLAETERRLADTRLILAARRSGLEGLRELERAREGYGAGVRAVFGHRSAAEGDSPGREATVLPGIVGTVADLLEVPIGLERAVEAVLGERLQWVVVERFEDARAAVAHLRAHGAGAATFLPLDHLPIAPEPVPDDNGLRWAVRSVGASRDGLARYLLRRVAIVEHLDHAEALWRRNGVVATYVTLTGEVLGPTGRLRGGADEAEAPTAEQSFLARKRRLRELGEEVHGLARAVEVEEEAQRHHEAAVSARRADLAAIEGSLRARQADKVAIDKDFEQAVREHERLDRHGETLRVEWAQVVREADETAQTLAGLGRRLQLAHEAETRHEEAMAGLRASIDAAREDEAALSGELTACRVEMASAAERMEALGRERVRLDDMETDLSNRQAQARGRRAQLEERCQWLGAEQRRADEAAQEAAGERNRMEEAVRGAVEQHEQFLDQLSTTEAGARRVDEALREQTTAIHECELRATEGRVRREELLQEASRTYGLEDEPALRGLHDPACDLDAVRQRCATLAEKLQAIGPVNLVADEEYRELDERLSFLRTQHDDLTGSIKDLDKTLRGMTRTAHERFSQAFTDINAHFQGIFGRLFEGGRAELRLVEPEEGEDPLETGVELMAQPRGKRLQSVTLMSGGERALTGLALLFAIFYYRPSPFCVLDEVDAPLDDANIHRFLRVLRELTSRTQFLIITHNRKTMEAADALYGVTMEEPGLSKVVSVNLRA
jgi:chromosome segregation protein